MKQNQTMSYNLPQDRNRLGSILIGVC